MAKKTKPSCVFCSKTTGNLTLFTSATLEKCNDVLEVRNEKNLSMCDAEIPKEVDDISKYHSKCYRSFVTLPAKHRVRFTSDTATTSKSEKESEESDQDVENTGKSDKSDDSDSPVSDQEAKDANESDQAVEEEPKKTKRKAQKRRAVRDPLEEKDAKADDTSPKRKIAVCIFCDKRRKKTSNREEPLHECIIPSTIEKLKNEAKEINDEELLTKLNDLYKNKTVMNYHQICKVKYMNLIQSRITTNEEKKTQWHESRDIHTKAYQQVCEFVSEYIIDKNQCFYLSSLEKLYTENAKNIADDTSLNLHSYNLGKRLLKAFPKKVSIVSVNNKKVLKPYSGRLSKDDIDMLDKQDIIALAANNSADKNVTNESPSGTKRKRRTLDVLKNLCSNFSLAYNKN